MHVLMASIPHSGTSLTIIAFEKAGFLQMGAAEPIKDDAKDKRLRWCHLHLPEKRAMVRELMGKFPLVCPMRHPLRLYESHKARSASETHLRRMYDAYVDCLKDIFPTAMILPVDADEVTRMRHKKVIEKTLGIDLRIDWKKLIGSKPPGRAHMPLSESRAPEPWRDLANHYVLQEIYHG